MPFESRFEAIWNSAHEFDLPEEEPERCAFAQEFFQWTTQLCDDVNKNQGVVFINQAKILLLDKYFEWRTVAPKSHRNRVAAIGHICIFQTFVDAYERLKALELSLTPPMLFLPLPQAPPPPPPQAQQIAGIFIGETEGK